MEKLRLIRLGRAAFAAFVCCVLVALAVLAPAAGAKTSFRVRIRGGLGLVPVAGGPDIAVGSSLPEAYHGGSVMRGVTVHTIFWAPSGYKFGGAPSPGVLGYEPLIQRYFTDIAHDTGGVNNVNSVLTQYGDGGGPGTSNLGYSVAADSIDATDPYPAGGRQCASPQGVAACVTDLELQQEIDHVIQTRDPTARGLNNLWIIFLPPNVDTCLSPGSCGSNAFGGYHSLLDLGHGVTIYAAVPDPLIELTVPPGSDPQGNPDAEAAIGTAAHETVEAITNPEGNAWMDPNGSEVGDKCELGPDVGTPLGYAPDGSPYSQLINGDQWLIQAMWSNASGSCVQGSTASTSPLRLAKVHLTQFSSSVSGSTGAARANVSVTVTLKRAGTVVARARTATRSSGAWGPVSLKSLTRAPAHAFGDDRDKVFVDYGAGGPPAETILTGNGGNPFTESGWTGWFDLDHGFAVTSGPGAGGVLLGPCFQTGVLQLTINGAATGSPVDQCGTETDVSIVHTGPIAPGARVRLLSADNRAVTAKNPGGALVSLSVPFGEANAVSLLDNRQLLFRPSGFPACMADLRAQRVSCSGVVPGARYTLTRLRGHATVHARAGGRGVSASVGFPGPRGLTGGDVVTLRNSAHRTLTVLHIAHLRVDLMGAQTAIASGTCEAGNYYGTAPTAPPTNAGIGAPGIAGQGKICPPDGSAKGLSATHIEQTDDLSGGVTSTDVPQLEFTAPANGATLYGPFTALAGAGIPTPQHAVIPSGAAVSVTITSGARGRVLFRAANVNTAGGVPVPALARGAYTARWVLSDAGGDTRTVLTRFVEAG
ncbi:MAG: copper resistance protein CopC [Actinomycetota bacterium]|nr:copper resistance protein CopC [Actinomycetota bacterium]